MESIFVIFKILIFVGYFICPVLSFWWSTTVDLTPKASQICRRSLKHGRWLKVLCEDEGIVVDEIMRGVRLALEECHVNMRDDRWDCHHANLIRLLKHDTKESAFVRAIASAGPIYSIVEACSRGLMGGCECKPYQMRFSAPRHPSFRNVSGHSKRLESEEHVAWRWRGCEDNIKFALKISRSFIDEPDRRIGDFKSDVHIHNHEAGRLASVNHMRRQCRCHGMSGSCVMQTCWLSLPYFLDVAQRLKNFYSKAVMVTSSNRHYNRNDRYMVPVFKRKNPIKKPKKENKNKTNHKSKRPKSKAIKRQVLVFSEESPNYCYRDENFGSKGTEGRLCDVGSNKTSECLSLCCGRGFKSERKVVESSCECKFEWCCNISCRECREVIMEHRCL